MSDLADIFASLEASMKPQEAVTAESLGHVDIFAALLNDISGVCTSNDGRIKVGRRALDGEGETAVKRNRHRARKERERCIAVLDFETDAFDKIKKTIVKPFLAVLYSDQFDPIIIWEQDEITFIDKVIAAIESLPDAYTIYAHNGGKFDYMFFVSRLRGRVQFKGRGIMSASIGNHQLRDSYHIIPEPLRGYKKDDFDYAKLHKGNRDRWRDDIIKYCVNDCKYLLQIVRKFVTDNGMKLSIGQAALAYVRKEVQVDRLNDMTDGKIRGVFTNRYERETYGRNHGRGYFYGGRVECLQGAGNFRGAFKLYDVNSMYPHVMAKYTHPVGASYTFRTGEPNAYTAFVSVLCDNNGALVKRSETGETTTKIRSGQFWTTIHEYNTAMELGLIDNVEIVHCVDCNRFSDFAAVVLPMYDKRMLTKQILEELRLRGLSEKSENHEFDNAKLEDMVLKFLLNNMWGKQAQNPRKYKDDYFTDPEGAPDDYDLGHWGGFPKFKNDKYAIWQRPSYRWNEELGCIDFPRKLRFLNVGTGASVTGAARSVLMRAIHNSTNAIYCDTDSLICEELRGVDFGVKELGAWKLEKEFDQVLIAGKKEYAAKVKGLPDGHKDRVSVKCKGVDGVTWADMLAMVGGETISKTLKGPTLDRYGRQDYITRNIRATA